MVVVWMSLSKLLVIPATFDFCQKIIGVDGTVANCGVHGKPVEFDFGQTLDSQHQCNNWFGIYKIPLRKLLKALEKS